jgi:predicted nucleic-acid-binding protein
MIALDTNVLARFYVEDRDLVQAALGQMRQGMDFADALHLAASHRCGEMITFDARRFAKRSNRLGLKPRCSVPLR